MKRQRESDFDATCAPSPKRQAIDRDNDENVVPAFEQHDENDATLDNRWGSNELANPFIVSSSSIQQTSGLSKYASKLRGSASRAAKINGIFRSTKTVTHECDEKVQPSTPKTPRQRNALSKKIPITPRHRITTAGRPQTPRTPITPSNAPTIYASARQLFVRSADPGRLVGRETERAELDAFISAGIASKSGRCMYVSGPPGTGKSALVSEVCGGLDLSKEVRMAYINCMSVKSSEDIFGKLIHDLAGDKLVSGIDSSAALKTLFLPRKKTSGQTYIVVLDEIDHLLTLDLEILYNLFEWSLADGPRVFDNTFRGGGSSRLILIGIANALDLTDRFLPRLKAKNLRPQLLPFLPYTVPQIASVITAKLQSLLTRDAASPDYIPFVHPAAIQFCSKKVASQTGDLRKAFDIVRRAIDLVENETRQKHLETLESHNLRSSPSKAPLVENMNLSSPCSPSRSTKQPQMTLAQSLSKITPENAPRASIAHVARVTASAFNHGTPQRLQSLNLQQKAALCSLVALEKKTLKLKQDLAATPSKSANAAPTIRKIYEMYCGLCRRDNALHPLSTTEFADVIGNLETLTLVQGGNGRGAMRLGLARLTPSKKILRAEDKAIVSCVSEMELEGCLDGPGGNLLRGILCGAE
ncbi:AAA ATPase [Xylographa opegraphella]|nr:AAA ATPase [Xylographa opegraphella]